MKNKLRLSWPNSYQEVMIIRRCENINDLECEIDDVWYEIQESKWESQLSMPLEYDPEGEYWPKNWRQV